MPLEHKKRERNKARALRRSRWWRERILKGLCHHCGKTLPPGDLCMDHLIPIGRGGYSHRLNIVPSCKDCNTKRRHHLAHELKTSRNTSCR